MDQIANLLYSWLQEEMLPKGYYIYSPEQGFLDYDADYDSVTAMIISDSGIYYGELSNGEISLDTVPYHFAVRSGYGIQFSIDDSGEVSIYRGNWENNSPNGEGTYYTQDYEKHCINGNWKDGKEDGTMTIAAGWKEEERTDVCEYERTKEHELSPAKLRMMVPTSLPGAFPLSGPAIPWMKFSELLTLLITKR